MGTKYAEERAVRAAIWGNLGYRVNPAIQGNTGQTQEYSTHWGPIGTLGARYNPASYRRTIWQMAIP